MIRMTSKLETDIIAVERIKEYTEVPTEVSSSAHRGNNCYYNHHLVELARTLTVSRHPSLSCITDGSLMYVVAGGH